MLSNTVLVLTPSRTSPDGTVHVRDQLHEVLELVPSIPKLHRLSVLLQGMEYDEGDEDRRVSHVAKCTVLHPSTDAHRTHTLGYASEIQL